MSNVKGKWAATGRGRDLFPGHQNGKGDKSRISDDKAYRENYDCINWGGKRESVEQPQRVDITNYIEECGCEICQCANQQSQVPPVPPNIDSGNDCTCGPRKSCV